MIEIKQDCMYYSFAYNKESRCIYEGIQKSFTEDYNCQNCDKYNVELLPNIVPTDNISVSCDCEIRCDKCKEKYMTYEEFNYLHNIGMLWEFYPNATGSWLSDKFLINKGGK